MNFYGDDTRWFVAKVINWEDNIQGRVKIRVLGLHSEDIPNKDLPWAKCVLPTTEGGTSGIGKIPQMLNGAFVFGMFLDGKLSQMPVVLGSMSQFELQSTPQKKISAQSGTGDVSAHAFTVDGVILNPSLVDMFNNGEANLETRIVIVMQFLLDAGIANPEAAAGVVGNLIGESNLEPDAVGSVGEVGIAQWNPSVNVQRLQQLQAYTKDKFPGKNYEDFFVQLQFLVYDMKTNGSHKVWNNLSNRAISHTFNVDVDFTQQKDTNATFFFLKKYEVPADISNALDTRQKHAQVAYDTYNESLRLTAAYAANSGGVV